MRETISFQEMSLNLNLDNNLELSVTVRNLRLMAYSSVANVIFYTLFGNQGCHFFGGSKGGMLGFLNG